MFTRGCTIALSAVLEGGNFSSFIDKCAGWPSCRLALDEFFQNRALFYLRPVSEQVARWFQKS